MFAIIIMRLNFDMRSLRVYIAIQDVATIHTVKR